MENTSHKGGGNLPTPKKIEVRGNGTLRKTKKESSKKKPDLIVENMEENSVRERGKLVLK